MTVVVHGSAVAAIWCVLFGHDRLAMPAFMVPDDLRSELTIVTRCMRCDEFRCETRSRKVYR